jgi:hypothetical protein
VAAREAKTRFDEGLKRYAAYDYEGAWAAFTQAYSVLKSADVLWNLCMAELRSGRSLEAIRHIRSYLRDPRTTDADRARAHKYLAEAHEKTGHVLLEVPPGARVLVDGASADAEVQTKSPVDLAPGKHRIECRQGTVAQSVEVDLLVGQSVSVRFLPSEVGQAPAPPSVVALPARSEAAADEAKDGESSAKTVLGVALAGGALVAIGVGVGLRVAASGANDDAARLRATLSDPTSGCYRAQTQTCGDLSQAVGDEIASKNASTGMFLAAGVFALGSAAVFLFWPHRTIAPPTVGAGGGTVGVTMSGKF